MEEKQCIQVSKIAFNSCVDSYLVNKDKKDIQEYWAQLFNLERFCEAEGVEKALELIELHSDIIGG